MNEFPQMSFPQQPMMGFNNQMNPNYPRQVMQEQRLHQPTQLQFEQMHQQQSFEQMHRQKFERSQEQQQQQQQSAMYHNSKRGGGYNLNQSAILFGNTTAMSPQMMQGNWHMQNQQMDQLNRSFNLMNLHTPREVFFVNIIFSYTHKCIIF